MVMWRYSNEEREMIKVPWSRESFIPMKLLCTVFKIWMCWKLGYETPIEDGLRLVSIYVS
jgi:hypothetical protein